MKVLGTIIDKGWNLAGLVLKGKPSELGISGSKDWMISHFSIDEAKSLIKKVKSCDFCIDEKGNIKSNSSKQLKDLPMYDMDGNPIKNEIEIESLIERNGVIVGGYIIFPAVNEKKKIRIEDIQNLCNYLNPTNFSVRVRDEVPYITGKGDTKREDIPVVQLKPEHTNKDLTLYMELSSFCLICELINGKNDTYSVYTDGWFCALEFPKWMEEKVLAFDTFDYYPEKNSKPEDTESGILISENGNENTIDRYKRFADANELKFKVVLKIDATSFDKDDKDYQRMFFDKMKNHIKDYDYEVFKGIYHNVYNRVFDNYPLITKELANTLIKYCENNKIKHEEKVLVFNESKKISDVDFIPMKNLKNDKKNSKFIDKLTGKYIFYLKD